MNGKCKDKRMILFGFKIYLANYTQDKLYNNNVRNILFIISILDSSPNNIVKNKKNSLRIQYKNQIFDRKK